MQFGTDSGTVGCCFWCNSGLIVMQLRANFGAWDAVSGAIEGFHIIRDASS